MAKLSSIQEQIAYMEERFSLLEKQHELFEKMIKIEFNADSSNIKKALSNCNPSTTPFEKKIMDYFSLKTDQDIETFLSVFCSENSLNYFMKKLSEP